jgi:hypothetical protein
MKDNQIRRPFNDNLYTQYWQYMKFCPEYGSQLTTGTAKFCSNLTWVTKTMHHI